MHIGDYVLGPLVVFAWALLTLILAIVVVRSFGDFKDKKKPLPLRVFLPIVQFCSAVAFSCLFLQAVGTIPADIPETADPVVYETTGGKPVETWGGDWLLSTLDEGSPGEFRCPGDRTEFVVTDAETKKLTVIEFVHTDQNPVFTSRPDVAIRCVIEVSESFHDGYWVRK